MAVECTISSKYISNVRPGCLDACRGRPRHATKLFRLAAMVIVYWVRLLLVNILPMVQHRSLVHDTSATSDKYHFRYAEKSHIPLFQEHQPVQVGLVRSEVASARG